MTILWQVHEIENENNCASSANLRETRSWTVFMAVIQQNTRIHACSDSLGETIISSLSSSHRPVVFRDVIPSYKVIEQDCGSTVLMEVRIYMRATFPLEFRWDLEQSLFVLPFWLWVHRENPSRLFNLGSSNIFDYSDGESFGQFLIRCFSPVTVQAWKGQFGRIPLVFKEWPRPFPSDLKLVA